eukprot:CAMPEP_0181336190 /NCGR_PEP_ID=MMETSP1101-20121128/27280_1 /TAXON_ID=46948 /ORGANISM="Rhodomonas abbreviata, Strain Caron Lab Isolate" /LENGTH=82 /DNA_ID=CAMNT_0023446455 /DNA_START=24 /DNA_END=268 /DNA_ORIENTATION=-
MVHTNVQCGGAGVFFGKGGAQNREEAELFLKECSTIGVKRDREWLESENGAITDLATENLKRLRTRNTENAAKHSGLELVAG